MVYLYNVLPQMFGLMTKWASSVENATASNVIFVFAWLLCGASAYLLGSLNSAIIVSTYKYKQDIRNFGSGNAGLTNMHRVYGKDGALLTLAGDIGKQVVSVLIGVILLGFSILMVGMSMMSDSVSGLKNDEGFKSILTMF